MPKVQKYAHCFFCDESGDLSNVKTRYLIGAVVMTSNPSALKQDVARTKKNARPSIAQGLPLHAADQKLDVVIDLLKRVAKREDIVITVAILDKQWIWNRNADDNTLYNQFIGYLVQQALVISKDTSELAKVILERRYTNDKHNAALIKQLIMATTLDEDQVAIAAKVDSQWGECLQVADAIAWSTYQKYEKEVETFFDLLQNKVKTEIVLGINGWGQICSISEMNNERER